MITKWLCKIGLHNWCYQSGPRHWHVECLRCGKRDIWYNFMTNAVYHPANINWLEGRE